MQGNSSNAHHMFWQHSTQDAPLELPEKPGTWSSVQGEQFVLAHADYILDVLHSSGEGDMPFLLN